MSGGLREAVLAEVEACRAVSTATPKQACVTCLTYKRLALASEADTREARCGRHGPNCPGTSKACGPADTREGDYWDDPNFGESVEVLPDGRETPLTSEADTQETEHIIGPGFYRRMYGRADTREAAAEAALLDVLTPDELVWLPRMRLMVDSGEYVGFNVDQVRTLLNIIDRLDRALRSPDTETDR